VRRRIQINPRHIDRLEDVTAKLLSYDSEAPLAHGALYDDPLWRAYLASREALETLEHAVIAHLRGEPYDEVEKRAVADFERVCVDEVDPEMGVSFKAIEARVITHAEDLYRNGEFPR
jgi:hypothetical protein